MRGDSARVIQRLTGELFSFMLIEGGLHRTLLTVNMPFKVFFVVQHFCQDRGSHFASPLFICLTTQNIMEHCGAQ